MNWSDLKAAFNKVFQSSMPIQGSGTLQTVAVLIAGFDQIVAEGGLVLNTFQSGRESVTITTDDNILPHLITEVVDRVLYLKPKPEVHLRPTSLEYEVHCTALQSLRTNGSAETTLRDIVGSRLVLETNGSGRLSCYGTVEALEIEINGSGNYDLRETTSHSATVAIAGSGDVTLHATDSLNVTIRGSGKVSYLDNPKVEQHIAGAGKVTKAS